MFDIFRGAKKRAIDEFGHKLAEDFMQGFPLDEHKGVGNAKSTRKLTRVVDVICGDARRFHFENKLDIYGKARLNNTLLWHLREAGYEDDFVNDITKRVIISLSQAQHA